MIEIILTHLLLGEISTSLVITIFLNFAQCIDGIQ